jgi:hypothetical protein
MLALRGFGIAGKIGGGKGGVIIVEWEVLNADCWIVVLAKRLRSVIAARNIRKRVGNCTSLLVRRIKR